MAASESGAQRKAARATGTINFLSFFGVPVRLHFTFLLLLMFLLVFGIGDKQSGPQTAIYVLAIFFSVLLHEMAHALAALQFGIRTLEVTVFPMGGVSRLERSPKAGQELWVALAGPLLNFAIGMALMMSQGTWVPLETLREPTDANLLQRLAVGNLVIALFNLLPAYPMDGGRILRAIVSLYKPQEVATQVAARTGKILAIAVLLLGVFYSNFFFIFISLFVYMGALREGTAARNKLFTSGKPVREAMITQFRTLAHGSKIRDAGDLLVATSQRDFPVTLGNQVLGLLSRAALLRAVLREGQEAYISGVMDRKFLRLAPETDLAEGMQQMADAHGPALVMDQDDNLVGMLTQEHLSDYVLWKHMSGSRGSPNV